MKKDSRKNLFVERLKHLSKIKRSHTIAGMLIAGIVCVALVTTCCAVFSNARLATAEETPYYPTLDGNYADVGNFNIVVQDGTGPFDTNTDPTAADYCNRPGNDSSDSNGIIRSYDTIFYQLNYTTVLKDTEKSVLEGFIWYECVLPLSKEKAVFNLTDTSTSWIGDKYNSLSDLEGADKNGYILVEENGNQILTGKLLLVPENDNPAAIPGAGSLYVAVDVMKMYQDEIVEPSFKIWLDHSSVERTETPEKVRVTSQLRVNVQLNPISESYMTSTVGNFDFTTGNDLALDKAEGNVYGVIRGYGITLQIYNDNNADGRNLKGCEMPAGDITFDLNLKDVKYTKRDGAGTVVPLFAGDGSDSDDTFKPLVWSLNVNNATSAVRDSNNNIIERNGPEDGRSLIKYTWTGVATLAAPGAYKDGSITKFDYSAGKNCVACSGGGSWTADRLNNNTVRVTVEDYYPKNKGVAQTDFFSYPTTDSGYGYYGSYKYFHPLDYNDNNPLSSISIGCFTAGKLYIVVPISDENGTLLSQYGDGTLNWMVSVDKKSLKVASQNAPDVQTDEGLDYRKQTNIADDTASASYSPYSGGNYTTQIRYSSDSPLASDVQGLSAWSTNGKDIAPLGQNNIGILWGLFGKSISASKAIYAANFLMKFDDELFVPITEPHKRNYAPPKHIDSSDETNTSVTSTTKYLYAFKKDGTGWVDDAEMNHAKPEDLIYCEGMETLKEWLDSGKVCVGILHEFRDSDPAKETSRVVIRSYVALEKKDDYSLVGNTYQTVIHGTIWNAAHLGIDVTTDSQEEISSKLPASLLSNDNVKLPVGVLTNADSNGAPKYYTKTKYDEYGNPSGWSVNDTLGDSLHIIGYKATISKEVTNKTASGEKKTSFNPSYADERTVNYKINPAVSFGSNDINVDLTTQIKIVDTIPLGLEVVRDENGAVIYECAWEDSANKYAGLECTLANVMTDEKGNTVLTWLLDGVKIGKAMPYITYSCNISRNPNLVQIGDVFTNTATIAPLKDGVSVGLPIQVDNKNMATAAIKITGLSQISFSKFADKPVYDAKDASDPLSWTMYMGNNSSAIYVDDVWLDVLPYDGDENGSDFAFPLKVTKWTLYGNNASKTFNTWEAYYTTDVKVRQTNAIAYDADEIRAGESGGVKWHKLTLTFNGTTGTVSGLPQDGDLPTALVVIGNLDKKEVFKATVAVDNSMSSSGEVLVNRFSRLEANVSDTVQIVSRSISGLVWWDANFDGLQDANENTITTGVKVTLLQLNKDGEYEPFIYNGKALTVPMGTRISGLTGKTEAITAGSYDFIELPAGTYAVRFEADNNEEFKRWSASPKNVAGNSNDAKDSDATPTYDRNERLLKTDITGIILPSIEHSTDGTTYITTIKREHNDSGLYAYTQNLNINKVDSAVREAIEGVEFTLYRVDVDANGKWNPIDSTATIVASNADGMVNFNALEPGYYILKETKAADGYHLPDTEWKLSVGHSGIPMLVDDQEKTVELDEDNNYYIITNNVTTIIPLTGGIGTDIFYVAGTFLVISSAIMLAHQRKRRAYTITL